MDVHLAEELKSTVRRQVGLSRRRRFGKHQLRAERTVQGIGAKGAATVLTKPGDPWANVVAAYEDAFRKDKDPAHLKFLGMSPEDLALLNARLARILRHTDWDGNARRPVLWSPEA